MKNEVSLDHGFNKEFVEIKNSEPKSKENEKIINTNLNSQNNNLHSEKQEDSLLETIEVEEYTESVKELFSYAFGQIEHYVNMLIEEGNLRGLIGPRELSRIWSRHIVNCAAIDEYIPKKGTLADIGSGAGLPGIVIAIMNPELDVHLIETMQRRVQWLQDCVEELGLDNVTIYNNRAQELHKKISFDCVTARAVGSIETLSAIGAPLIRSGGKMVLLKGDKAGEELEKAKYTLKKHKLENPQIYKVKSVMYDEETTVVEIKKR
ncbi:16S rRNA (guanine(527)-N(7))-methyltransferase RsmG [Actinomyces sp. zg-332]|uniref:16S rRNA (guanine(527)-N(7))-methyltransferase RsmG n=1 Tax=Actinomyces sp. zg-332 TaxID=2708340 RepID=UPI002FCCD88B